MLKKVEPVVGGREGLMVDWVCGCKIERAWEGERGRCVYWEDWECRCKIFYQYFKCKRFYTCLP